MEEMVKKKAIVYNTKKEEKKGGEEKNKLEKKKRKREREQKGWRNTTAKMKNIVLFVFLLGHVWGYFLDMYADNSFFITL